MRSVLMLCMYMSIVRPMLVLFMIMVMILIMVMTMAW